MTRPLLKKDKYYVSRGGYSRFIDILCNTCRNHICFYQKDGPGAIHRMYLDRIIPPQTSPNLICPKCHELLGVKYVYPPENRPAYKIFLAVLIKKIVKVKDLPHNLINNL